MRKLGAELAMLVAGLAGAGAMPAKADMITFSGTSSDETPASVLDAMLHSDYLGNNQFRLMVMNQTTSPFLYTISDIYFNTTPNITSIALAQSYPGVTLLQNQSAGPYGLFEYQLNLGSGPTSGIAPGMTGSYLLNVTGSNFNSSNLVTQLSTNPPGSSTATNALKFVSGPGGDSAWGTPGGPNPVPEPTSMALTGAGLLGLAYAMRKYQRK
jgi:hypothetical protein